LLGKQNNKVLHRAYRNTSLTDRQKQENKQRSSIRYIVERTFGLLKQHHGLAKARYLGLERNKTRAQLFQKYFQNYLYFFIKSKKNLMFPAVFLLYFSIFSPLPLIGRAIKHY
jgi:IS5 family transposase